MEDVSHDQHFQNQLHLLASRNTCFCSKNNDESKERWKNLYVVFIIEDEVFL